MQFYYTYILYSPQAKRFFVSFTDNLKKEVQFHNNGEIRGTKDDRPWNLLWYAAFRSEQKAKDFAEFLRTSDGKGFIEQWLIPFQKSELPEAEVRPYDLYLKPVKHYTALDGSTSRKANCDVEMAFYLTRDKD